MKRSLALGFINLVAWFGFSSVNAVAQEPHKQEPKQEKQEPKPQPSKISKQDAEEKLKSLLDHEKDLQDKLHKVRASGVDKPKKDW